MDGWLVLPLIVLETILIVLVLPVIAPNVVLPAPPFAELIPAPPWPPIDLLFEIVEPLMRVVEFAGLPMTVIAPSDWPDSPPLNAGAPLPLPPRPPVDAFAEMTEFVIVGAAAKSAIAP